MNASFSNKSIKLRVCNKTSIYVIKLYKHAAWTHHCQYLALCVKICGQTFLRAKLILNDLSLIKRSLISSHDLQEEDEQIVFTPAPEMGARWLVFGEANNVHPTPTNNTPRTHPQQQNQHHTQHIPTQHHSNKDKNIIILQINIKGILKNKVPIPLIHVTQADKITIQETQLTKTYKTPKIAQYAVVRTGQLHKKRGSSSYHYRLLP